MRICYNYLREESKKEFILFLEFSFRRRKPKGFLFFLIIKEILFERKIKFPNLVLTNYFQV
jgi:hypothetical protein